MANSTVPVLLVVGLLAGGKSTVLSEFEKLGAKTIRMDTEWQKLYNEKNRERLAKVLGIDVLKQDGSPNKALLRSLLFPESPASRNDCAQRESALHQEFDYEFFEMVRQEIARYSGEPGVTMVVVENALGLIQKNYTVIKFNKIVSLVCDQKIRRERAMARNPDIPPGVIDAIMAIQPSDDEHYQMSSKVGAVLFFTDGTKEVVSLGARRLHRGLMEWFQA